MKKLFRTLVAALILPAAIVGSAEEFNALRIDRADGATEYIQLHSSLTVKYMANAIILSHPEITVEYPLDELTSFSFANNTFNNGPFNGNQNALEEVRADEASRIAISPEAISVSGKDDIVLYDLRGVEKARAKSDGNAATLKTAAIAKGVYILRAGDLTLKISL